LIRANAIRLANHQGRAVRVVDGHVYDVSAAMAGPIGLDMMGLIRALVREPGVREGLADLDRAEAIGPVDPALLGPPVPRPSKVFGLGLNYRAHAEEAELDVPNDPMVFTKFPSCLVGPEADIVLRSNRCDYEGELVVVIGEGGRDIPASRGWSHVLGLMVGQDISDRRVQFRSNPPQFSMGKSFDTFGPTGPVLTVLDGVPDPATLRLRTHVNGELRQDDTADHMIWSIPELIASLSAVTTLEPGDLVFTGTPKGIGSMKRLYLQPGDVVETSITGLGTLRNRCVSP
jgi:2-keto-4-pentenoate hydratase/2-oxohepta-3-ene-1,7-dioic acid hydratase in catechol pathway